MLLNAMLQGLGAARGRELVLQSSRSLRSPKRPKWHGILVLLALSQRIQGVFKLELGVFSHLQLGLQELPSGLCFVQLRIGLRHFSIWCWKWEKRWVLARAKIAINQEWRERWLPQRVECTGMISSLKWHSKGFGYLRIALEACHPERNGRAIRTTWWAVRRLSQICTNLPCLAEWCRISQDSIRNIWTGFRE